MLVLLEPIMGCGRSKQSSKNSSDDSDRDVKQAQKMLSKVDKSNKIGDRKENEDPERTGKNDGNNKRDKGKKQDETSSHMSPLKTASLNYVNNGNVPNAEVQEHGVKTDSFTEGKTRSSLKDRLAPGNAQNMLNLTTSQIEFFKMLDEKIEQGRDYFPEDAAEG